jgi:glucokinase
MSGQLIGVDVGGTKVSCASLRNGVLEEPVVRPTAATEPVALVDEIVEAVEALRAPDTAAVGVGVPSVVEFATGRVKSSVNVKLADIPLRTVLQERLGVPVFVDNDATCAALAEAYEGDRITVRHLVMITVGTGIGGGLVIDGRVYRGTTGAAGEIGHTLIAAALEHGVPAAGVFPQAGSLEAEAAGRALDGLAEAAAIADPGSMLGRLRVGGGKVSGREVIDAALAGDEQATGLIQLLGNRLGIGIANAINVLDPEEVVIGGGVAVTGDLLLEPAREVALRFVLPGVGEQTVIRLARHGAKAGVLGAALLAGHELEAHGRPA